MTQLSPVAVDFWTGAVIVAVSVIVGLNVLAHWPEIRQTARAFYLRHFTDPYPQTPETIARAKQVQLAERAAEMARRAKLDIDGFPLRTRGLGQIHTTTAETVQHYDFAAEKKRRIH